MLQLKRTKNTNHQYCRGLCSPVSTENRNQCLLHITLVPPIQNMAIATYISVTCAATPMSPDPSASPPPEVSPSRRPTKIILPKKKPMKWSTGMAPGDYGGPPTTTKLRKYWGGEEPDPLTSDDYIWNKDFMGRFQRMIKNPNDDYSPQQSSTDEVQFFSVSSKKSSRLT